MRDLLYHQYGLVCGFVLWQEPDALKWDREEYGLSKWCSKHGYHFVMSYRNHFLYERRDLIQGEEAVLEEQRKAPAYLIDFKEPRGIRRIFVQDEGALFDLQLRLWSNELKF